MSTWFGKWRRQQAEEREAQKHTSDEERLSQLLKVAPHESDEKASDMIDDSIPYDPEGFAQPDNHTETPESRLVSDDESADDTEATTPYTTNQEYLVSELHRIRLLVRAHTRRWYRLLESGLKPEECWGLISITDEEIQYYLHEGALVPEWPTTDEYWYDIRAAARQHARIDARLEADPNHAANNTPLRLQYLRHQFALTRMDLDILLLCLLPEIDERYRRLYGFLMDDATLTLPTVRLLTHILEPVISADEDKLFRENTDKRTDSCEERQARTYEQTLAHLEAHSPLIRNHLVSVSEGGSRVHGSIQLDARIVKFILSPDDTTLDPQIFAFATMASLPTVSQVDGSIWGTVTKDQTQAQWLTRVKSQIQTRGLNSDKGFIVWLRGEYGSRRVEAARLLAPQPPQTLLIVDVTKALKDPLSWEASVDRCYREAKLQRQAAVYWSNCELLHNGDGDPAQWAYLLDAADAYAATTFFESTRFWLPQAQFRTRGFVTIDFPTPSHDERRRWWEALLTSSMLDPSVDRTELILGLANSFQFTPGQIEDAILAARARTIGRAADGDPRMLDQDLYAGCRMQTTNRIGGLAQRIKPRSLRIENIILPEVNRRQIVELLNRIAARNSLVTDYGYGTRFQLGMGLLVLFTGSSGTGKTMAAELLANTFGVDVFRVDLSAVVSKYVGETEKNFNRLLSEAEGTNAILFFDEADALFGKRGEVKEAQDRWANMEVNYLLQRIEQYSGVVILASNLRQNIDEAFMRRIHVIVDFPFPDERQRVPLWQMMLDGSGSSTGPQRIERYPDAEFHARTDPRWARRLASLADGSKPIEQLSRAEIFQLLAPEIGKLDAAQRDALLGEEVVALAERFRLAGGNIKNIVVDATVRAITDADANSRAYTPHPRLLLRHIVQGVAREYQKVGKPITSGEFGKLFFEWVQQDLLARAPAEAMRV